jgi:DNA-binding transcriptional MocR family regulator
VTARGAAPGPRRLRGANSESASCTAYEQLIGEGFATGRRGGGTVVAVRPDLTATRGSAGPATPAEQPAPSVAVDLTPGRPASRLLRDTEWRSAWRRAVADSPPTGLPDPLGVPALREAVAVHLHRARGVEVTADEVLITAGTSDALALAAIALASPERRPRIVVADPGYTIARRVLSAAGAHLHPLPVDSDGPRVADLAELTPAPDAVLLTPSHQYPLGGRMPVQERVDLLHWAANNDVVVLEDDYDSEFRHRRRPLPATTGCEPDRREPTAPSSSTPAREGLSVEAPPDVATLALFAQLVWAAAIGHNTGPAVPRTPSTAATPDCCCRCAGTLDGSPSRHDDDVDAAHCLAAMISSWRIPTVR